MLPEKSRIHYHIAYPFTVLVLLTIGVAVTTSQTHTKQVLSDYTSSSLPPTTSTPTLTDMMILVSVKYSGIGFGGNKNPLHPTRKVTAYLYNSASEAVATNTAFLSYDGKNLFRGSMDLGKLAEGSYIIKLVSDNALQALVKPEFLTLFSHRLNEIPTVTFYQGDTNGDKVLTNEDLSAVLSCLKNSNSCQTTTTDFDDDGKTDVADYNLLLQSFRAMRRI